MERYITKIEMMELHPNPDDFIGHLSLDTKFDLVTLRKLRKCLMIEFDKKGKINIIRISAMENLVDTLSI